MLFNIKQCQTIIIQYIIVRGGEISSRSKDVWPMTRQSLMNLVTSAECHHTALVYLMILESSKPVSEQENVIDFRMPYINIASNVYLHGAEKL